HTRSIQEIVEYMIEGGGNNCATLTTVNNQAPTVDPGNLSGVVIPISTPFKLVGSATDPEGDPLTYCWEQANTGPAGGPNNPQQNAPIFRSFDPTSSPVRYFPRLTDVINNTTVFGETYPTYSRNLTFRLTVRDNELTGAGVAYEEVEFIATNQAGPFVVTDPNNSNPWSVGEFREVKWDVANTDQSPVNCKTVNILLSRDGGLTYLDTLARGVANDGLQIIQVPNLAGNTNRVMVEAADNIFFDISNQNFAIQSAPSAGISAFNVQENWDLCRESDQTFTILTAGVGGYTGPITVAIVGLLPGVTSSTLPANPVAGDTVIVTLSANATATLATTNVNVVVAGNGGIDDLLSIQSTVFNNIQASTSIVAPALGELGVSRRPLLVWSSDLDAETYTLEVATNPSFAANTIVETRSNISDTLIQVKTELASFTPYYWRVSADNICSRGNYTALGAFQTDNCLVIPSDDTPIVIPAFGSNTQARSEVFIPFTSQILDINVLDVNIEHANNSELTFLLQSPDQTVVTLSTAVCGSTSDFFLSYDDVAIRTLTGCNAAPVATPLKAASGVNGWNTCVST
ncbi:MAG: hypothetical protein AAFR59_11550, partial [Bacteroidota bacterium]